jgi:hypothetical protein
VNRILGDECDEETCDSDNGPTGSIGPAVDGGEG